MMIAIMAVYLVLLFALVRTGIVSFNLFWKSSPFIVLLLLKQIFRIDPARSVRKDHAIHPALGKLTNPQRDLFARVPFVIMRAPRKHHHHDGG